MSDLAFMFLYWALLAVAVVWGISVLFVVYLLLRSYAFSPRDKDSVDGGDDDGDGGIRPIDPPDHGPEPDWQAWANMPTREPNRPVPNR